MEIVLLISLSLTLTISLWAFIDSSITRNYSFVDRIWSIVPFVYCWIFAIGSFAVNGSWDARATLMAILTTLWGLRLTFNFARKGGYDSGEQDYRWPIVKGWFLNFPLLWHLFNLLFISLYQNILLFSIAFPAYACYLDANQTPFGHWDYLLATLFLILLLGESIADNQQWEFQTTKYRLLKSSTTLPFPYSIGFLTSGLFSYCRHPNYFCEIMMWVCIFGFSHNLDNPLNVFGIPYWSGFVQLALLFISSTILTEQISSKKYPHYRQYQRSTPMLIPFFPK